MHSRTRRAMAATAAAIAVSFCSNRTTGTCPARASDLGTPRLAFAAARLYLPVLSSQHNVMQAIGRFARPGIGYSRSNGLTFDGAEMEGHPPQAVGVPRLHSAPSKESLHLIVLAMVLSDDAATAQRASLVVSPEEPSRAREEAIKLLDLKLASYRAFGGAHPGYRGFLPWWQHAGTLIDELDGWGSVLPGLDNGQFAWAIYLVSAVLSEAAKTDPKIAGLAGGYRNYLQTLEDNVGAIFFDSSAAKTRGLVKVVDVGGGRFEYRTGLWPDGAPAHLYDPYEGDMMTLFLTLFGGLAESDKDRMWAIKQGNVFAQAFPTKYKSSAYDSTVHCLGVLQLDTGSAHELWALNVLPYEDVPVVADVLRNTVNMALWESLDDGHSGLFAAAHEPLGAGEPLRYAATAGIPDKASGDGSCKYRAKHRGAIRQDFYSPMGAFPAIALDEQVGTAWLRLMLADDRMESATGLPDSIGATGEEIARIATWDVNGNVAVAYLSRGVKAAVRGALQSDGKRAELQKWIGYEYSRSFPAASAAQGLEVPLALP